MKKILGKIKKIFIMIEAFFIFVCTKGFAAPADVVIMYGVSKPEIIPPLYQVVITKIWDIMHSFVIPLVLLIGAIIYLRKSPKSLKRKIIKIAIIVILTILICIAIDFFISVYLFD